MFRVKDSLDGDVPMLYNSDAVKQSIRNILMWRVGENILRPNFGHNIHKSMYTQMHEELGSQVGEEIKRAITDNEPRVTLDSVAV